MLLRALLAVILLSALPMSPLAPKSALATEAGTTVLSVGELMHATALDEVFTQFGPTIEAAPDEQGLPFPAPLRAAWVAASRQVFDAGRMHAQLEAALDGRVSPRDGAVLSGFLRSEFGRRISELERAATLLDPAGQFAATQHGLSLLENAEAGSRRHRQIEEILQLMSADIAIAMVGQSVRGMLIGMSMMGHGDIEVPWEEIDAQVEIMLPQMQDEIAQTQRAMLAFVYRSLDDSEIETYLEFLRTDAAQRFYALATLSVGQIVTDSMSAFGRNIAERLGRVGV
jgi:hypothetical protein